MIDAREQFRAALTRRNIIAPANIIADGAIHRCDAEGRNGKGDAAYLLHLDRVAAGGFENWRDGLGWESWHANIGRKLSPSEAAELSRWAADTKASAATERKAVHDAAAKLAADVFKSAEQASANHPYLKRKRVAPVVTLRELPADELRSLIGYAPRSGGEPLAGRVLIAPVRIGDALSTLEFIDEVGRKSALAGGAKAGGFWSAQRMPEGDGTGLTLLLAEGVATAITGLVASGHPAFAGLSCGNLTKAATALRVRYPSAKFIVLADLGNGERHAHEAARAVGGLMVTPDFGDDRPADATDLNDLAQHRGREVVERAIASAAPPEVSTLQTATPSASAADSDVPQVTLLRGDTINPVPISWLWAGYLAAGKLHLIAGAAGTGKTTLALDFAAAITIGGRWPDGTRAPVGDVLIWSGEDSLDDTLVPRLRAAGADMARVHFVGNVHGGGAPVPFDPATHFPALALAASRLPELRLMLVDPVVSSVPGDSHKNAEVRRGLQPLVTFAECQDCALVGITHFTKGTQGREPLERVTGSLGFGAVARIVLGTAKVKDEDGGGRVLVRVKSNIGPDGGGFRYELRQVEVSGASAGLKASRVEWAGPVDGTAREILATAEQELDAEQSEREDAANWLRATLIEAGGELPMREAIRAGERAGYKQRTLQRARVAAGVSAIVSGFGREKRSVWRLGETASMPPIMPIMPTPSLGMNGTNGGVNDETGEVF